MAEEIDGVEIGSHEASDAGKRLRESSHDDVHIIGHSEMVAHATAFPTEDAQSVSLVDIDAGIVFLLQFNDGRKICKVTLHREHTVYDNHLDGLRTAFLQLLLQVFHVVVLVFQAGGKRKTTAVDNTCMVTVVANDIVFSAADIGKHA